MLNWKYTTVALIAAAAIVPSICQNSQLPLIGKAHATQQPRVEASTNIDNVDEQAKPKERKRMARKNFRAFRELHAKRNGARSEEL